MSLYVVTTIRIQTEVILNMRYEFMAGMKKPGFIAAVLSLLFLSSCTGIGTASSAFSSESAAAATNPPKSVSFRITWKDYSGRGEAIRKIVDSYNSTGGLCTVSMISGDEDLAATEALIKAGGNTVYVLPYRLVKYFGALGYLKDLSSEFKASKDLFYPSIWSLGQVDDVSYGIPWLGHSMCLLYNKSLLEQANVDPASITNLDSLVQAMEAVESKTSAKGIGLVGAESNDISWMVNQFVYGFGSKLVSDDGTKVAVNNDKAAAAIDFYKNILGAHAQQTWTSDTGTEVMNSFRDGQVAFEIQGIWGVTDIIKNGSPFEVGIISLSDIGLCSEVGPMMLAIPASMSDDMMKSAVDFMQYMISKPAEEMIMNGEYSPEHDAYYPFRTPIRIDMASSPIFKAYPEYMKFVEGFENPSIDVPVPLWQTIKDQIYAPGLHKVMTGEMTTKDFLAETEEKGNSILEGS
jgi:multiple sugar transport system substrate-binding protein